MEKKRKQLVFLSKDQTGVQTVVPMFSRIIGNSVNIESISIKDPPSATTTPDAVLVSGSFVVSEARKRFPGVPIVIPKRIITGENLEEVIMLPTGEEALVVTSHREVTKGTIQGLINLGIQHVNFIPTWSFLNNSEAEVILLKLDNIFLPSVFT